MIDHSALIERLDCLKLMELMHPAVIAARDAGYLFSLSTDTKTVSLTITVSDPLPSAPNQAKEAGE